MAKCDSSPEGKPPFSYGFPMVFLWFSSGFPMVFLWFSYGFPLVFLWFSYGFPMVFLWFSYGFPMVFEVFQVLFFHGHVLEATRDTSWLDAAERAADLLLTPGLLETPKGTLFGHLYNVGPPFGSVQLVQITPIKPMVYGTYNL